MGRRSRSRSPEGRDRHKSREGGERHKSSRRHTRSRSRDRSSRRHRSRDRERDRSRSRDRSRCFAPMVQLTLLCTEAHSKNSSKCGPMYLCCWIKEMGILSQFQSACAGEMDLGGTLTLHR